MKFTLGFSPCPNDTFIFDALVNNKIDTGGIEFDVVLEDVQTLNEGALEGRLQITKLSFPALFQSLDHYTLLNAGSALGKGVGPLLIRNKNTPFDSVANQLVAIPGQNTTANFLFSYAYPDAGQKVFMRFDKIEDFVLNDLSALGVIIHENRFTYHERGLEKVIDLGTYWEEKTKLPIPLGGIAIHQSVKRSVALTVDGLIRDSLQYAFNNYPGIAPYVKEHSQEMSEEVMRQHIDLYVNQFSLDLGDEGKAAILGLYDVYLKMNNLLPGGEDLLFL